MFFPLLVFASIFSACCLTSLTFAATLAKDEVEALTSIGRTLGKANWNFGIDPCSRDKSWEDDNTITDYYVNKVVCNCSFNNNTTCHVVKIVLRRQNLSGTLPPELVSLPFLQEIDLNRNYLSGTIPSQWGSMQALVNISLMGNRLTGSIPKELGNISTLTGLNLGHNNFSGNLTSALGNLPNIEILLLRSNNFTGELPETFARLTTLKQFKIGDNNFIGKIPDFIFQNWTNLNDLYIVASGLSGPIPSIDSSKNLTKIIISDLNGAEASFPKLSNLPKLERLMLRSCNLTGKLPTALGELNTLQILDLSFNRLSGPIPSALSNLIHLDQLFLTGNMFTGVVPQWIREANRKIDLSYNNFTSTGVNSCQQNGLNLFASTSRINNSGTVSCLASPNCPAEPLHFLYINCGGRAETVDGAIYEADLDKADTSRFFRSTSNWAFSSGGVFLTDDRSEDIIVLENTKLSTISGGQLYTNARHSPSSLTYYAFCLDNATYKVNLHFAEIQFTDDQSYSSLGRRIFDVYIQRKLALKDFNIRDEADGTGKPVVKIFAVNVSDGTLEILLRWAGKGTTSIPTGGVYGPLISAISVIDPDYKPRPESRGGITAAAMVGIIAGATLASFLIGGFLWWNGCLRWKSTLERDLKGLELQTSSFTLRQIKAVTNNFDAANKIGEGGFGPVYKGMLANGTPIAVKQLSARSKQGNREFVTEIGMISALQHPHLVKLYGCCSEGNQLLLIYEYLENNSLARALYGPEEFQLKLDLPTRQKICIGIARGLAYLHEESRLKIVHRDIKTTNVLLDKNLNPKISDFGLAKLNEEDNTHISTRIAGTYGYIAPEYAMHGHLTDKADVYSFGIVTLEIVSGSCNTKNRLQEESLYLLDWARMLKKKGNLLELVDPRIGSDYKVEEAMAMINVALLCTNPTAVARPSMSSVVSILEGRAAVQELLADSSISGSELEFLGDSSISASELNAEAMKELYWKLEENDADNSQTKSMLAHGSWTSTFASDLYTVNLSSEYWENRVSTN